ncbi:hypothetical protein [Mucilaginibacter paludis]|uniref:Uncharacterized protein n=1 Tax=Mucilaginibacter paludis DSM 18603 TaxID=714943 RepID=H1YBY9_9SPHI|nr:hypothetical protein [Mucilaginibacter paludis]EHQ27067.1 hypothetical protein Mucpa_2959 [Mucilaginibacter paludis DSM 18603]
MVPLSTADFTRIKDTISKSLSAIAAVTPAAIGHILPKTEVVGKLYEAHVLSRMIQDLHHIEGLKVDLIGTGGRVMLKQKGGPINRAFPYFKLYKKGILFAELFTDTYFSTLSYSDIGGTLERSSYHELDIALLKPNCAGTPSFDQVFIAAECKATDMQKSIFREILGFRRELGCLVPGGIPTNFDHWPETHIRCNPASVHIFYCTDKTVDDYKENAKTYGIVLKHEPMS